MRHEISTFSTVVIVEKAWTYQKRGERPTLRRVEEGLQRYNISMNANLG